MSDPRRLSRHLSAHFLGLISVARTRTLAFFVKWRANNTRVITPSGATYKRNELQTRMSEPPFFLTFRNLTVSRCPWSAVEPPTICAMTEKRVNSGLEIGTDSNRWPIAVVKCSDENRAFPEDKAGPKPRADGELATAEALRDHNYKTNISKSHNKSLKIFYLELSCFENILWSLDLNKCPSSPFSCVPLSIKPGCSIVVTLSAV